MEEEDEDEYGKLKNSFVGVSKAYEIYLETEKKKISKS